MSHFQLWLLISRVNGHITGWITSRLEPRLLKEGPQSQSRRSCLSNQTHDWCWVSFGIFLIVVLNWYFQNSDSAKTETEPIVLKGESSGYLTRWRSLHQKVVNKSSWSQVRQTVCGSFCSSALGLLLSAKVFNLWFLKRQSDGGAGGQVI